MATKMTRLLSQSSYQVESALLFVKLAQFISYIRSRARATTLLFVAHPTISHSIVIGPRRTSIRLVAARAAQPRPVPPVAPVSDSPANKRPDAHIVYIMAVILAPADGNHQRAQQRREAQQCPDQIPAHQFLSVISCAIHPGAVRKDAHLPRKEKTEIAQSGEREGAVARGKGAPPVVKPVVICLCAHVNRDESIVRCALLRDTTREQVRARPADGVFDDVR